jgi:hypothetical protein
MSARLRGHGHFAGTRPFSKIGKSATLAESRAWGGVRLVARRTVKPSLQVCTNVHEIAACRESLDSARATCRATLRFGAPNCTELQNELTPELTPSFIRRTVILCDER